MLAAVGSGAGAAGRKMSILENSKNDIQRNVDQLRLLDYFNAMDSGKLDEGAEDEEVFTSP